MKTPMHPTRKRTRQVWRLNKRPETIAPIADMAIIVYTIQSCMAVGLFLVVKIGKTSEFNKDSYGILALKGYFYS